MKGSCYYIALAFIFLVSLSAYSQQVRPVALAKYTQNDGLSSYFITKIVKDSYGFLWVGTQEGLNLFDGRTFQTFSKQSPRNQQLGGSFVADIVEDKKRNLLWVLTSYGDVCAFDLTTRTITRRIARNLDGVLLTEKWARCLRLQGDTLWIGGLNVLSAYFIPEGKFADVDFVKRTQVNSVKLNVNLITFDKYNRMWLFSDGYGIAIFDNHFNLVKSFHAELASRLRENKKLRFWNYTIAENNLYVASSWGLISFKTDSIINYIKPIAGVPTLQSEILSLSFTTKDNLLFSTPEGFYQYNYKTKKLIAYQDENKDDDWLSFTYQLLYDSTVQKVWVGTQSGLASFSLKNSAFKAFTKSRISPIRLKHVYALLPISEKEVYCGDEDGVFLANTNTKEISKIDTASANLLLFKDVSSNVFLSNKNGFYQITEKRIRPAHINFPELLPLNKDHLHCGIQYNDSLIIFSSIVQKGLSVWNTANKTLKFYHNDSLQNRIKGLTVINYLFKGKGKDLFILTEKSIIRFNPISSRYSTHVIKDKEKIYTNFMDMHETDDSYWLATYGNGLIETSKDFKLKKVISTANGLSNNCVYRIFHHDNQIIGTTNNGIAVVDSRTYHVKNYFRQDGLQANAFEQLCGYQQKDKIFVGGVNGFTIIEPALFSKNTRPPNLYWNNIRIDTRTGLIDSSNIALKNFKVPNNVLQATISFSGLNYANPSRVTYSYKIMEIADEWINLAHQNFVNLIGLGPGTYTLQVKACNEDNVCSEKPLKLKLVYLPKWYQTWWFKLIILFTGVLLIQSIQQYRINQLRKQQQIRKEIANDLHDDIGSTLNSIKNFTYLSRLYPENSNYLNKIEESLNVATFGLRDMIWVLDDSEDTIFELMDRIKRFALPVCEAKDINFTGETVSEKVSRYITKAEKRNLFLITKECINNSIKYSRCSNIKVSIIQKKSDMALEISDDGCGFNLVNIMQGNGLKNIRYRSKQIFWDVDISSSNKGTTVFLQRKNRRLNLFYSFWQRVNGKHA